MSGDQSSLQKGTQYTAKRAKKKKIKKIRVLFFGPKFWGSRIRQKMPILDPILDLLILEFLILDQEVQN